MLRVLAACGLAAFLSACATTSPAPMPGPVAGDPVLVDPGPDVTPTPSPDTQADPTDPVEPYVPADPVVPMPSPPVPDPHSPFRVKPLWASADMVPALKAFQRSCSVWEKRAHSTPLQDSMPVYGQVSDWLPSCRRAQATPDDEAFARHFFESEFYPIDLDAAGDVGLVTGYYQPEINVRAQPDRTYSEPILAMPSDPSVLKRPRSRITASSAPVIGWGRPIEVFFMQVQGSGVLAFPDGRKVRAAYAANNGYNYTSIGRVLVNRGEMTLAQASKQSIEEWMSRKGPVAARDLMNENKRYIFFQEQVLTPGEGPTGAMSVPLTAMGSLAVDPKFHPYGSLIWIEVKTPRTGGDYVGTEQGHLVVAQDTGKAITGVMRGDLYFGSGFEPGEKAGVMKHRGRWSILLPIGLATRLAPAS